MTRKEFRAKYESLEDVDTRRLAAMILCYIDDCRKVKHCACKDETWDNIHRTVTDFVRLNIQDPKP